MTPIVHPVTAVHYRPRTADHRRPREQKLAQSERLKDRVDSAPRNSIMDSHNKNSIMDSHDKNSIMDSHDKNKHEQKPNFPWREGNYQAVGQFKIITITKDKAVTSESSQHRITLQ